MRKRGSLSSRSTKAGDYPRLRRLSGVTRQPEDRSTKAGDYPRLRRLLMTGRPPTHGGAQRRPEITPGYDHRRRIRAASHPSAQRRPEITPGYDRRRPPTGCQEREGRSTKAGDYPRLRPGGGGVEPPTVRRSTKAGDYPRLRPADFWENGFPGFSDAQRRPEITPGYDAGLTARARAAQGSLNEGRRLPPATTPAPGEPSPARLRSTKAGDYPRLRHQTDETLSAVVYAQRRPEITPGYDAARRGC